MATKVWTLEEFHSLPDDGNRYELIYGELFVTPAPSPRHERLAEALHELARSAYRLFGKGRHPAGLNFGDCFAYALAQELGEPLLFVGEDFSKTDVVPVELP